MYFITGCDGMGGWGPQLGSESSSGSGGCECEIDVAPPVHPPALPARLLHTRLQLAHAGDSTRLAHAGGSTQLAHEASGGWLMQVPADGRLL